MGRLIPVRTGLEYYRSVKIAGEDVAEEESIKEATDLSVCDAGERSSYAGRLTEENHPGRVVRC